MTEHNAFELRLGRALNRHVEGLAVGIDAVELTESIAAEHERRWRLGAWLLRAPRLPWTARARQVAWMLLLAGLLVIMAIAALLVGSRRPVAVFACPFGSTPDAPGPVDQPRPAGSSTMAFDRRAGRLVALADAGHGVETWTFDVCTNTWARMHPDGPNPVVDATGPRLVYDVDSDLTIGIGSGKVWAYDLEADTWTKKGPAPTGAAFPAFDPISGLVIAAIDRQLWGYDVETDRWTPIAQAPWNGWGVIAYDTAVDRIVAYGGGGLVQDGDRGGGYTTWLFDVRTGTWSRSGADTPAVYCIWGMAVFPPWIVYDEASERTVIGRCGGNRIAAYDASADRWEMVVDVPDLDDRVLITIPGRPENGLSDMVYDPVNRRLVTFGSFLDTGPDGRTLRDWNVLAVDLLTRGWTVLLEARERQAAPSPE